MTTWLSHCADDTMRLAADLAHRLRGGEFIALHGDLGAGKTCFVRGLAQGLGIDPAVVSSPTFVIMHEYDAPADFSPRVLLHIDAYRLRSGDELEGIGWEEILGRRDAVIALEWPQRLGDALPADRLDITLEHRGEEDRMIRIEETGTVWPGAGRKGPTCPTCRLEVSPDIETFPFCSHRCRMADLHRWMGGEYKVSRPATDPQDWQEAGE